MKKLMPVLAGTVALTAFASVAHAQDMSTNDSGLYVGGNYGYLKVDGDGDDNDFDDNNDVWQGLVGYRFNEFFAIEGGYTDFGSYGSSYANAETDGYSAAVKGILPLTDQIEFFAKAGQLESLNEKERLAILKHRSLFERLSKFIVPASGQTVYS